MPANKPPDRGREKVALAGYLDARTSLAFLPNALVQLAGDSTLRYTTQRLGAARLLQRSLGINVSVR